MARTIRKIRKKGKKKKQMTFTSYIIIGCIFAFTVMAGLLFQHSDISEANNEIRNSQKNLESAIQINDSKEGQLVTNMNLQAIEAQARGYGMKEPTQSQYRRETTAVINPVPSKTEKPRKSGWFENLF